MAAFQESKLFIHQSSSLVRFIVQISIGSLWFFALPWLLDSKIKAKLEMLMVRSSYFKWNETFEFHSDVGIYVSMLYRLVYGLTLSANFWYGCPTSILCSNSINLHGYFIKKMKRVHEREFLWQKLRFR